MIGSQIIYNFEKYVGDQTELSDQDELDLLNRKYTLINDDRPWEFLKKVATGTITANPDGSYSVPLPVDFKQFAENDQQTNIAIETENNAAPKVIFCGTVLQPFQIVNFSDRRSYKDKVGYAYLDLPNNRITFLGTPPDLSYYEFDYIFVPPILTLNTSPIWPIIAHHELLQHLMATDEPIMELFDKGVSRETDNAAKAAEILANMRYWNANLNVN